MKPLLFALLILSDIALSQTSQRPLISVFYFDGSNSPHANDPKYLKSIAAMRADLPKTHQQYQFKFVLVIVDKDIQQALQYAKLFTGWDEISVGQDYRNELMLEHVSKARYPVLPHFRVYRDSLVNTDENVPKLVKRTLLVDLGGEGALARWSQYGYALDK